MKKRDKCRANNKRRHHATPPAPVFSSLCLTVFGHHSESIGTLTKSNGAIVFCNLPVLGLETVAPPL